MGRSISESQAYKEAKAALDGAARLPKLIVFDLDYTIWPMWCEMYDESDTPALFSEAPAVLQACRDHPVQMAVASRSPTPNVAAAFLRKLGITDFFDEIQIIPYTQKDTTHFPKIRKALDVPYQRMLFFDDENGNIARVSRLGVTSILVSTATGVNVEAFRRGLREHMTGR